MIKNKENTKSNLIKAVSDILKSEGYESLNISKISKTAGVDKALVYRYFGNLDGLLSNYFESNSYYANQSIDINDKFNLVKSLDELSNFMRDFFTGIFVDLLDNKEQLELIRLELNGKTLLAEKIKEQREMNIASLIRNIVEKFNLPKQDISAFISILTSAIYFIAIKTKSTEDFNGIELKEEGLFLIGKMISRFTEQILFE